MESGRWIDGRYEPFGLGPDWAADAPTLEREVAGDAGDATPEPAEPAGDVDAPTASRSQELAPAGALAVAEPAGDEFEAADAPRRQDALLRLTAAVMLPLSVVAIATATTVLVGEDPAPLSAEAAPATLDWSPGVDGLPAPGFTPRGLPTLPAEPVPSGRPAADAATQPERVAPRDTAAGRTTGRTTAGSRRIPAPAVVNGPRRPAPAPAGPATQPPPANNGPFRPTGPPVAGGGEAAAVNDPDPTGFDIDTPTATQEPAPQEPAPQEPAPQEPAPQEPAPQEPAPQEPAPQDPILQVPAQ